MRAPSLLFFLLLTGAAARADVAIPGALPGAAADCDAAGKRVEASDVNGDGKPDFWRLYDGKTLTCRKSDMNYDGRADVLVHYKPGGYVWLEEYDLDFDGRIDLWRWFDKDRKPLCDAMDFDADGKPDAWRRYENGRPVQETAPRGACASLPR
jgi:hypothetical protein